MLTLTVSSKNYLSTDEAAADLKRGLVALRKRITRRWPSERLPFIAVFERHKSGFPHLHLLIRARFIPHKWLKRVWTEITGSWMVDIRKIKANRVAAMYVAKYIGKDLAAFEGCKRWWRSHDYEVEDDSQPEFVRLAGTWSCWSGDFLALSSTLRALGAEVETNGKDVVRWRVRKGRPVPIGDAISLAKAWWPSKQISRLGKP